MEYNNLSALLRRLYGAKIRKFCIDGGFTCPNRDGTCGVGGCIFCGERGSGEHIQKKGVAAQMAGALASVKPGEKYIAYFQNFTGTYAPIRELKEKYDAALCDERSVALTVGRRPDCVDDGIAALLASYKDRADVWIELGLQTESDDTAARINRGYKRAIFDRAMEILSHHGVRAVVHLMVGLPGEDREQLLKTVEYVNRFPLFGVKLHSTYVCRDTELCRMYERGEYEPLTFDGYIEDVIFVLAHLRPDFWIHRLTGDSPGDLLVAPLWVRKKDPVLIEIRRRMAERGLTQGCFYQGKSYPIIERP
jgi:radical SAM protein (TIGR01212 family)